MRPCRIIIADDHEIFRAGLKSLIGKEADMAIVAEAKNGADLLAKLPTTRCDLVVLDLSMPLLDGMEAMKDIRRRFAAVKILVLTMQKDPEHFKHAMVEGAAGYILKDDAYEELVLAIRLVMKDKNFVSPAVAALITDRYIRSPDEIETPSLAILTRREREVLKFVASGLANKNIAAKLKISIRTVETHRAHLYQKLGIRNTAGLVKYALAKGLV